MESASLFRFAWRRERLLVLGALLTVIGLSWAYLLSGAGMLQDMGGMLMPMSSGPWSLGHALLMLCMWVVMMLAMMLPSAMPMILLYGTLLRKRGAGGEEAGASIAFAAGYVAVWSVFSLAAVALQFGLEQAALLSPMMETSSKLLAAALLVSAGVYQWTPLKLACLRRCGWPLEFLATQWREGRRGAFVMGTRHAVYCVGCCWLLMLLLFVGGVMNLAWIAGLAAYVLLEKLSASRPWMGRGTGLLLILWGVATLFTVRL